MTAEEYHLSLRPLEEVCRQAGSGWICLRNPLVGYGRAGSLCWKTRILIRHIGLVWRCWESRRYRHILVREFSTIPLLAVFPLLYPLRKKLFFMINHNLQWAARNRIERYALAMLARLNVRWALFETQELFDLTAFNIPSEHNLVLPHPVSGRTTGGKNNDRLVLGVAGYYRPEKGMDELLELLSNRFADCDLVLGVSDTAQLKTVPARFKVVSTTTDEAYRQMLAGCDVLVQNGARGSYFYRASGPVADAAACGTAVVVPDFPLLKNQVTSPVRIGEVFQALDKMPDVVRTAIESVRSGRYDFDAYCAARSVQALACQLDEFSRRTNG